MAIRKKEGTGKAHIRMNPGDRKLTKILPGQVVRNKDLSDIPVSQRDQWEEVADTRRTEESLPEDQEKQSPSENENIDIEEGDEEEEDFEDDSIEEGKQFYLKKTGVNRFHIYDYETGDRITSSSLFKKQAIRKVEEEYKGTIVDAPQFA